MEDDLDVDITDNQVIISNKDLFKHLFAELISLYDTYIKYVFATTTSQLLILGWLMTRNVQEQNPNKLFVITCLSAMIIFTITEITASFYIWKSSQKAGKMITDLKFIEDKHFNFKVVNAWLVLGMIIAHTALYVLIFIKLIYAK